MAGIQPQDVEQSSYFRRVLSCSVFCFFFLTKVKVCLADNLTKMEKDNNPVLKYTNFNS